MKNIIYYVVMALFLMTSCTLVDFMSADDVENLGYEVTEDAVYSKAQINGYTVTAKLSPVKAVHTKNIPVLVSTFVPERKFTVKKIAPDKVVSSREDRKFRYETWQYTVILESYGLEVPCYYQQERAYYKVGNDSHLMPVPEVSATILEETRVKQLADENIDNTEYKVWTVEYAVLLKSGESEFVQQSSSEIKYYENLSIGAGFGIIIEDWKGGNPEIEVEI